MSAMTSRCICGQQVCLEAGNEATIELPSDGDVRAAWLEKLGINGDDDRSSCDGSVNGRVCLSHFPVDSLTAEGTSCRRTGEAPPLKLKEGAEPSQTGDDIKEALVGALGRAMRWEAAALQLEKEALDSANQISALEEENRILTRRLALPARNDTSGGIKDDGEGPKHEPAISYRVLDGLDLQSSRRLCGLCSLASFEDFFDFIDDSGVVKHLNFYRGEDDKAEKGDPTDVKLRNEFAGRNGLFLVLFVLRTAVPVDVASVLFGVDETIGQLAFVTWVHFLAGSLAPLVHLPDVPNVVHFAPPSFQGAGLERTVLVLSTMEVEVTGAWPADAAEALWSSTKRTHTGKAVVGSTPAGAICYLSNVYGGALSGADITSLSGLVGDLESAGFGGDGGFSVMADGGFFALGADLARAGVEVVSPPKVRAERGERQSTGRDAVPAGQTTTSLRFQADRTMAALKEWKILRSKVTEKDLGWVHKYFQACSGLVNMTHTVG